MKNYIDFHKQYNEIIYINIYGKPFPSNLTYMNLYGFDYPSIAELRISDLGLYILTDSKGKVIAWSVSDNGTDNNLSAILSILRTIFVCFIMLTSVQFFSRDIQRFIIDPVEDMTKKIDRICKNPLEAA